MNKKYVKVVIHGTTLLFASSCMNDSINQYGDENTKTSKSDNDFAANDSNLGNQILTEIPLRSNKNDRQRLELNLKKISGENIIQNLEIVKKIIYTNSIEYINFLFLGENPGHIKTVFEKNNLMLKKGITSEFIMKEKIDDTTILDLLLDKVLGKNNTQKEPHLNGPIRRAYKGVITAIVRTINPKDNQDLYVNFLDRCISGNWHDITSKLLEKYDDLDDEHRKKVENLLNKFIIQDTFINSNSIKGGYAKHWSDAAIEIINKANDKDLAGSLEHQTTFINFIKKGHWEEVQKNGTTKIEKSTKGNSVIKAYLSKFKGQILQDDVKKLYAKNFVEIIDSNPNANEHAEIYSYLTASMGKNAVEEKIFNVLGSRGEAQIKNLLTIIKFGKEDAATFLKILSSNNTYKIGSNNYVNFISYVLSNLEHEKYMGGASNIGRQT